MSPSTGAAAPSASEPGGRLGKEIFISYSPTLILASRPAYLPYVLATSTGQLYAKDGEWHLEQNQCCSGKTFLGVQRRGMYRLVLTISQGHPGRVYT